MSDIKEKDLSKLLGDLNALGYFRVVDENGDSKGLLKTLLRLEMSQITGLDDEFDKKVSTPEIKQQTAYIKSDGSVNGSGRDVKNIANTTEMNAVFSGEYSAHVPFFFEGMGMIQAVLAFDDSTVGESAVSPSVRTTARQLVFSDQGIYYREYSLGGWGLPMFIGGSINNQEVTGAEARALASEGKLTPGTLYKITDHVDDLGIVIQAATGTEFMPNGIRVGLSPRYYTAGIAEGVTWLGMWRFDTWVGNDPSKIGAKIVHSGRVWVNRLGNIGSEDGWGLNADDWNLSTELESYNVEIFGVTYDLDTDWISKQWDSRGNVSTVIYGLGDDFLVDYNDWGNPYVYGNDLKSFRNNVTSETFQVYNNNGGGDIHDNNLCQISENVLTDENNNIRYNSGHIINKNVIQGNADIDSNGSTGSHEISYNTISGDIKGNTGSVVTATIIGFNGKVKDCNDLSVTDSLVNGLFEDNTRVSFNRSVLKEGGYLRNKTSVAGVLYEDSILDTSNTSSETLTSTPIYVREDLAPKSDNVITLGTVTNWFSNIFSKIGNFLTIDSNGEDLLVKTATGKTIKLNSPVYEDVNAAVASAKVPPSNTPTWAAFTANTNAYTFAIDNYADLGTIEIPHSYKEGTDLEIHLHLATNGTNNATARKAKYTVFYTYVIPDNGTNQFSSESSLTAELTIPANQLDKSGYYLSMGTISGIPIKIGTQLKMRIKRIAGTGTEPINDPFLGMVGVHYQKDTIGSRSMSAK
jgi:hypothetical protein